MSPYFISLLLSAWQRKRWLTERSALQNCIAKANRLGYRVSHHPWPGINGFLEGILTATRLWLRCGLSGHRNRRCKAKRKLRFCR